jgi:hypothetical protein
MVLVIIVLNNMMAMMLIATMTSRRFIARSSMAISLSEHAQRAQG